MVERIVEQLKSVPDFTQAEVLDFVEYLKSKESQKNEKYEWAQFSLESAMRGIEEEPSPYGIEDIKAKF
ncbi:MAG: DUF2281 domain-containing protein [Deltaproteobacteria bacterium]|nr:DUF2281 domain-containing protein [Deltaproteobacteria bacterium]